LAIKTLLSICGNEIIAIDLWQQNNCHMEWNHPRTIIGPPAEGESYLKRHNINELFWQAIGKGEFVRFTAPRRVGKSSVMKDLENNPPAGMLVVYQNIESDQTSKQFYKRLWRLIVDKLDTIDALRAKLGQWYEGKSFGAFSFKDLKLQIDKVDIDLKSELLELIEKLGGEEYKLVLLLDEFPDVIMAIKKNEGEAAASEVLHTIREIRHNKKFKNFSIVLAGSIGLQHVVAKIDRTKVINDLKPIDIPALDENEAHKLLDIQLKGATMQLSVEQRKYLFNKVNHLLPYYLQLMIAQCSEIAHRHNDKIITPQRIDEAFDAVVANNENFSDWEIRLRHYMPDGDYSFCIGLLTRCAHKTFTLQEAFNFSKETKPDTGYKALIDDVLVKDGYLVYDGNTLKFLSPFLQAWWKNRHPDFEIEN
jgi:hypothetical protein